jgi:hypothetical protein
VKPVQAGGIIRTSLDNTWKTPEYVLDAARAYFGGPIPFDAATTEANHTGALRFAALPVGTLQGPSLFPEPEKVGTLQGPDGLALSWDWPTWCNPPYGEHLKAWLAKIAREAGRGAEILALLPCSRWEQAYLTDCLASANAICFHRGRISFISSIDGEAVDGNPTASMFLGCNVSPARFVAAFGDLGRCFTIAALQDTRRLT